MKVNGAGLPDESGFECGSEPPEDMPHPQCLGGVWQSNPDAYAAHDAYLARIAASLVRARAKISRASAIESIVVTVSTGKIFDGDEESQARMSRAMLGMQAANVDIMPWTLADNTIDYVTRAELTEAMILAGTRQSELWPLDQYM